MSFRTPILLLLGAGLLAGATACGTDTSGSTAGPGATTEAPATGASEKTEKPAADAAGEGCPVDQKTLLKAMEAASNPGAVAGVKLSGVECADGYAIAGADRGAGAQKETEVFQFKSGAWKYLIGGSADYCTGVPAAAKKEFRSKGYDSCN